MAVWQGVMESILRELTLFLVTGMVGTAPETTLDALAQLLQACLARFPHLLFPLLTDVVASASPSIPASSSPSLPPSFTPAAAQLQSRVRAHVGLQTRLLPLLARAVPPSTPPSPSSPTGRGGGGAWLELSAFRDMALDVWAYCQGSKGVDALDKYL